MSSLNSSNKPRGQACDSSNKPRGQAFDSSNKPRGQAFDSSNKPRGQAFDSSNKPREQAFDSSNKPREQAFDSSNKPREYPERTTDHGKATSKLYHLWLRVECTLFCNQQSRARTHAVLVIGLYELLAGNPSSNYLTH